MITIISGTNRENNLTLKIAKAYSETLTTLKIDNQILDLSTLPEDFIFSALYGIKNDEFTQTVKKYINDVPKMVIISPEYNGSYPGILKAFIDGWDPRSIGAIDVALVGTASGRQGNARGMDHLTNVLNYLGLNVIPFKLPISKVFACLDENGTLTDTEITDAIKKQISQLV